MSTLEARRQAALPKMDDSAKVPESTRGSSANRKKLDRLEHLKNEAADQVLRAGFYGKATLTITVQDGTISDVLKTVVDEKR